MKLSPVEILKYLGFDIPDDGIFINPNDLFLFSGFLGLIGKLIDVDQIPDAKLIELHREMAGIVSGWVQSGWMEERPIKETPSTESLEELRSMLKLVLRVDLKHQKV